MPDRREFLRQCSGLAAACGLGLVGFLEACKSAQAVTLRYESNRISFLRQEFPQGKKPWLVISHQKLAGPVFLYRNPENKLTASLLICTHKGCEIEPAGKILLCPCHSSEFSLEGKVLTPPAQKDLFHYTVEEDAERISILLQ